MNKILSNIFKGLLVALVVVVIGGFTFLNIKGSPNTSMILISSSIVNSLNTDEKKTEEIEVLEDENLEETEAKTEEKIEETTLVTEEEKVEEAPKEEVVEHKEEVVEPVQETNASSQSTQTPSPNGTYSPNTDAANGASNNTFQGYMTAYGPDCYGCYGSATAMGDYVGEGNIYYNHPTYGNIRIVTGDRSILNKVVRITGVNLYSEPVIAIVRDTGGDIGFNKPKGIVLDLLFPSEYTPEAANFGKQWVTVEILN